MGSIFSGTKIRNPIQTNKALNYRYLKDVKLHDEFDNVTNINDIAVARVEFPFDFSSENVITIPGLETAFQVPQGK